MEAKKVKLNEGQKKKLIGVVKRKPVIWDKTNPDHVRRNILKLAWEEVAKEMDVSVEACKMGWRSIRDSERYYRRKMNNSDLVRDVDYMSDNSSAEEPWEFTEEMMFLVEPSSSPRLTYSSAASNMSPDRSTSSYSYRSNSPTPRRTSGPNEPIFKVVEIVECKEEKIDDSSYTNFESQQKINHCTNSLTTSTANDVPSTASSKSLCSSYESSNPKVVEMSEDHDNVSFLNHLDTILKKLPIRSSESLQAKIIAQAYEELAKQRHGS